MGISTRTSDLGLPTPRNSSAVSTAWTRRADRVVSSSTKRLIAPPLIEPMRNSGKMLLFILNR
jgi:hypothetical protein